MGGSPCGAGIYPGGGGGLNPGGGIYVGFPWGGGICPGFIIGGGGPHTGGGGANPI